MRIELVDGSRIVAGDFDVAGGQVTLSAREMVLTGPSKAVAIAHLKPTTDAAKTVWTGLRTAHKAKKLKGDVLVITRGETVDSAEGVLHDTAVKDGRKTIKFEREEEPAIEVPFERVDGLIYLNAEEVQAADPVCIISDADGSMLRLKAIVLKDGRVEFETVGGFKGSRPLEQLTSLDFSIGKVAYLGGDHELSSDELGPLRKPLSQPLVNGDKPPPSVLEWSKPRSKNRVLPGDKLTVTGHEPFERGLYLKTGWEIEYPLRGRFRQLRTLVGIDASNKNGRAELVVEGDGKPLFRGMMQHGEAAKLLDLDVSQVRILKIRAIRQGGLDGILDLCDARVTK